MSDVFACLYVCICNRPLFSRGGSGQLFTGFGSGRALDFGFRVKSGFSKMSTFGFWVGSGLTFWVSGNFG